MIIFYFWEILILNHGKSAWMIFALYIIFQISLKNLFELHFTFRKKHHFAIKTNSKKTHIQKRYLLWPFRNVLNILNKTTTNNKDSFQTTFDKPLSFSLFYNFIKAHKIYIFIKKIPRNNYLCRVCENTYLLGKG